MSGSLAFLAGRWLLGLRRRTHIATVSTISFIAMALGAAALVITLALLEGFQSTIRRQLMESGVHAEIRARTGSKLPTGDWVRRLEAAHPELEVEATEVSAVWCLGPDGATPARLEVVAGLGRVEVNRVLAARLGAGAGYAMTIASPRTMLTPLGPTPIRRQVEIGAVFPLRPGEEGAVVRAPVAIGRSLLGNVGPQLLQLRARDPARAWDVASIVQKEIPDGAEVVSFRELNRPLLAALGLERTMIGFGVALVMVVAALNLLCNLALVAAEKRADVALLSALGLPPRSVFRLFLSLGLGVGVLGGVLGAGLGAGAAVVLDVTRALPLPRGVFVVSHVPFRVTPSSMALVVGISLVAAVVASLAPARAAARRDVVEGLRYE